jgi:phosphoribosylamine--glycine ligase
LDSVPSNVQVFHAGTREEAGSVLVNGGRVLSVTALGNDLHEARKHAYEGVSKIHFDGEHHRSDIALKAADGEITVP